MWYIYSRMSPLRALRKSFVCARLLKLCARHPLTPSDEDFLFLKSNHDSFVIGPLNEGHGCASMDAAAEGAAASSAAWAATASAALPPPPPPLLKNGCAKRVLGFNRTSGSTASILSSTSAKASSSDPADGDDAKREANGDLAHLDLAARAAAAASVGFPVSALNMVD